jgi:hypothetical protein
MRVWTELATCDDDRLGGPPLRSRFCGLLGMEVNDES